MLGIEALVQIGVGHVLAFKALQKLVEHGAAALLLCVKYVFVTPVVAKLQVLVKGKANNAALFIQKYCSSGLHCYKTKVSLKKSLEACCLIQINKEGVFNLF